MGARVVLDTNVFISALGWDGKPEACLEMVLEEDVEGYISPPIVDELRRVMDYPRFDFVRVEKETFLEVVLASFHVVDPEVDMNVVTDDPDDDMFVECAVAAGAGYIVSGDEHLQELDTVRDIDVVSPGEFLAEHETEP